MGIVSWQTYDFLAWTPCRAACIWFGSDPYAQDGIASGKEEALFKPVTMEVFMKISSDFPEDFQQCVRFHGHVCPGLAIGYAAARAALTALKIRPSPG